MSKRSFKRILLVIMGGLVVIVLSTGLVSYWLVVKDLPDISSIDTYRPSLTSKLYALDDTQFAEFAVEKRTLVDFAAIPEDLTQAVVAVEDARFYRHNGLDWQGITRAFWKNVRARKYVQGASTITQQLARALFLTRKKTLRRKAQEALLALRIEERYSKQEILELYLNQVYLGRGAYGVEAAAHTYFDKPVSKLNLAESAFMAGLPRAPSYYNPYRRPEVVENRRRHVLQRMLDEHSITEEQFTQAAENPPRFKEQETKGTPAPYFTEYVRRQLEDKYGSTRLYRDGLRDYTTLDLELQRVAQAALTSGLEALDKRQGWRPIEYGENLPAKFSEIKEGVPLQKEQRVLGTVSEIQDKQLKIQLADKQGWLKLKQMAWAKIKNLEEEFQLGDELLLRVIQPPAQGEGDYQFALEQYPLVQGAILAIDPHNGYIKSMVGGYDFGMSKFNRAVQAKRQPGSAFKPIIYSAALSQGFTPASVLLDAPIIYTDEEKAKEWKPVNYHERFVGPTTLRDALEHSRNVVTIKLLRKIGVKKAVQAARDLGIESELSADLSLALGSSSLSLLELTSAYGVFVAGGLRAQPLIIRYVTDSEGNMLEENTPRSKRVLGKGISYLMTNLLRGVVEHGTGWRAKKLGRPLAGKTGTTNQYIDAWFIGFSPRLAVGVWTGFDEPHSMGRLETGSRAASPIWVQFMRQALKDTPLEDFQPPQEVVEVSIDAKSGMLATHECDKIIKEAFVVGTEPTEPCNKHRPEVRKFLQADLAGELDIAAGESSFLVSKPVGERFPFD